MDCEHIGQSVVHVAVRRGASDAIRLLVSAGVNLSAPCCFAVDEVDEPEWDEKRAQFNAGLKGLTALQLLRRCARMTPCARCSSHMAPRPLAFVRCPKAPQCPLHSPPS